MKTIKEFINTASRITHAKVMSIIYTLGSKREARKQKRLSKKYSKAVSKFNLVINPHDIVERYVVINGDLFRVNFLEQGISIRDSQGELIECQLTGLKVLQRLISKDMKCN